MKKFLIRICIFTFIIVFVDTFIGFVSEYLREHAKGGSTANNYYIAENCTDDIIILGSSRSTHHYIPKIFEDSLNMSCYNCGEEGNGIVLAYGRYKMITQKHSPKFLIYEITPEYDCYIDVDNSKYFRYLKPYYNNIEIKKIIDRFSTLSEKHKMCSKMYQNNSGLLTNVVDNVIYRDIMKGYSPMYGILEEEPKYEKNNKRTIDTKKMELFRDMIIDSKQRGINLIFVISPFYLKSESKDFYMPLYNLCDEYDININDFRVIDGITGEKTCFNDNGHMNHKGATLYTKFFVNYLKSIIQ